MRIVLKWITPPIKTFSDLDTGLLIVSKIMAFNKHVDQKMLEFGLIDTLEKLTPNVVMNGETNCQVQVCMICVNLLASDISVAKEFRKSKLPSLLMNFFCNNPQTRVLIELMDCYRIFFCNGSQQEIFKFLDRNISFLEFLLKFMDPKGSKRLNITSLLVLNKILGEEKEYCKNEEIGKFLDSVY